MEVGKGRGNIEGEVRKEEEETRQYGKEDEGKYGREGSRRRGRRRGRRGEEEGGRGRKGGE